MADIKLYKELVAIETFWGILYTPAKIEDVDHLVETKKFILVGDRRLAVHQIKEYYPKKLDTMESFVLSQPSDIKKAIENRMATMKKATGRERKTVKEVQAYINTLLSNKTND